MVTQTLQATMNLELAEQIIDGAVKESKALGVAMNIAVLDGDEVRMEAETCKYGIESTVVKVLPSLYQCTRRRCC